MPVYWTLDTPDINAITTRGQLMSRRKQVGYKTPQEGEEGEVGRVANERRVRAQFLDKREITVSTLTTLGMEISVARSTLERMTKDGKLTVRCCRDKNSGTNYYSLSIKWMLEGHWIVRDKGTFLGNYWRT